VINMRFVDPAEGLPEESSEGWFDFGGVPLMLAAEVLVLGIVAVLVLLLVVRPLIGRMVEGGFEGGAVRLSDETGARAAIAAPLQQDAIEREPTQSEVVAEEIEHMIDIGKVEGRVRASSVKKIGEIVDKHPDEAVAIIRNWLYAES
jgi:flagellar M-ring protein FliF